MTLTSYDHVIVAFSGGKDSLACFLHLLDLGVPKEKIELWHHVVDGREGSDLMDWPGTTDYCQQIAKAFGVPLYLSWKSGGFEQEMMRNHSATARTYFETPEGLRQSGGNSGKLGTRLKFPQVSADLRVRWCSAYLKIDVAASALRNQARFNNKKTLMVTGERAQESPSRAKYPETEVHRSDNRAGASHRHIDHWRPIHRWTHEQVWALLEKHRVQPHAAYRLGWGRLSCAACIFGNADQWASLKVVLPEQFNQVADYETRFGITIRRNLSVSQRATLGDPYPSITPELIAEARRKDWTGPVFVENWQLPAGAAAEQVGPT